MRMYMVATTQVICNEIKVMMPQTEIIKTYAQALISEAAGADRPDWDKIGGAIVDRWGGKAHGRIKERAHSLARRLLKERSANVAA